MRDNHMDAWSPSFRCTRCGHIFSNSLISIVPRTQGTLATTDISTTCPRCGGSAVSQNRSQWLERKPDGSIRVTEIAQELAERVRQSNNPYETARRLVRTIRHAKETGDLSYIDEQPELHDAKEQLSWSSLTREQKLMFLSILLPLLIGVVSGSYTVARDYGLIPRDRTDSVRVNRPTDSKDVHQSHRKTDFIDPYYRPPQAELPEEFVPYSSARVCSNELSGIPIIVQAGDQPVLMVGSGRKPHVWLNGRKSNDEWYQVVQNNIPKANLVSVKANHSQHSIEVRMDDQLLLSARQISASRLLIDFIDLSPIGIAVTGSAERLEEGKPESQNYSRRSNREYEGMPFLVDIGN